MTVRTAVARAALAASGLPRVPSGPADEVGWPVRFTDPVDGPTAAPHPLLPYLRWLAENRPVVFHGSQRRGMVELSDERRSRDQRAYGDQQAVFASQDPVWALFFAVLRRDELGSTRNGSLGADRGVRGRRYFMSVRGTGDPLGPGALYVLPDDAFAHEPLLAGLFDTAHRTHVGPVTPLGWFDVTPEDFPLAGIVTTHRDGERAWRTLWNARRRARSGRP
jgi:hypothetical protein